MAELPNAPGENVSGRPSNYYETLTENAEVDGQAQNSIPQLSKKDRKKLKKLKKRAALVLTESERSGLLTRSEYEEYQSLVQLDNDDQQQHAQSEHNEEVSAGKTESPPSSTVSSLRLARPSVSLRKKCIGIEKVEGSTNRDLLSWLLQQKFERPQQQSRKRQRDDSSAGNKDTTIAVPHWASIHNPGACEQVAVLEVHLPNDNIDSYSQFFESYRSGSEDGNEESNSNERINRFFPHSQFGVATKWFQGYIPKSMSETLLYFSNSRKENKTKTSETESSFSSRSDLVKRLETMLLSPGAMTEQGYPNALTSTIESKTSDSVSDEIKSFISRKEKLQSPDTISLEKAKAYVSTFGVRVEHQKVEDKNPYINTPSATSSMGTLDHEKSDSIPNKDELSVRVFGLDCEMVLTTIGSELARVTLVEFDEFVAPKTSSKTTVLLDCLVRPENRIVDYLTKHSGITHALLEPVTTRLEQVQCALASYLAPTDILIGHSLENDLRALHYIHPRIIDTSMIFRPSDQNRRFKFSLRHLSATLLKKPIQNGSHCSEEDAQTALDLALLKALKGDNLRVPGFGDNQKQSLLQQQFVKKSVAAFIGPNEWLKAHITKYPNNIHALNYDSPDDCKKAMLAWMRNSRKAHLIWSKIELGTESSSNHSSEGYLEVFKSLVVSLQT